MLRRPGGETLPGLLSFLDMSATCRVRVPLCWGNSVNRNLVSSLSVRAWRPIALAAAAAILLAGGAARAQQADTGIIVGSVLDSDNAVLPGVSVTVVNQTTAVSTTVVTNERGQYRTPPLRIGTYDVSAELQGFRRFERQGVPLSIGDVRNVDAVLSVGGLEESITVEGALPVLNTSDSTVGTVLSSDHFTPLPLNGRDYLQLAALSAGTGPRGTAGISIGGQAGTQVAFLLDGQDNNKQTVLPTHGGQKEVIKPSVDAIQEFKVVTNGYAAEYGRSSSGVISVSIKGGTNAFKGGAYEFFRDDAFDARNAFASSKPDLNRNQYGAYLGGPVLQGRTFFFADVERGRIRRQTTQTSTLPSDLQRSGLFSRTLRDPLTGQSFADNSIPAGRVDPVAARILSHVPNAQTGALTNNFVFNSPNDENALSYDVRLDHVISPAHNVFVRASSQVRDTRPTSPLPTDPAGNFVTGGSRDLLDSKGFVGVYNRIWTPNLISSIRGGWNRAEYSLSVPDQGLKGVGIPGVDSSQPVFSQINITGYRTLGVTNVPNFSESRNTQISGDITWARDAHTFKAGVQAYSLQTIFRSSQRSGGIFTFNGQYTGDPFADFLLGYASSSNLSKWALLDLVAPYTHAFVQDDWRLTRRLTLNLGLRYELNFPLLDKGDHIANYDLDTDPANPRIVQAGEEGRDWASRALVDINYKLFAPRVGLAYSLPDEKTVVRLSGGTFYSNIVTSGGMQSLEINPPNHLRVNISTDRNAAPTILLRDGFSPTALTAQYASDVNLVSHDRSNRIPTSYQANVNVQRELPGRVVVEAGYTFNKLTNMLREIDGNPALPGAGTINRRRLIQTAVDPESGASFTLANVTRIQRDAWSRYDALQTKVERRYSNGVSLLAAYTWSRSVGIENFFQNPNDQAAEVSRTSTDRPHIFVLSGTYQLPFGQDQTFGSRWTGWKQAAFGGWSISPIVSYESGDPLDLTVNGNPSNSSATDRPNVVGDWRLDNPTADRWFDTSAFVANAPFTYGNAPRNAVRGPSYRNIDVALRKEFRVSRTVTAELRFESFNAGNWVNLGNPNTQVGNINFGVISSAESARNNQVAVKFRF